MYGIDVEDEQLMQARSWRWLRSRINGLFNTPDTRIWRVMRPAEQEARTPRGS